MEESCNYSGINVLLLYPLVCCWKPRDSSSFGLDFSWPLQENRNICHQVLPYYLECYFRWKS